MKKSEFALKKLKERGIVVPSPKPQIPMKTIDGLAIASVKTFNGLA